MNLESLREEQEVSTFTFRPKKTERKTPFLRGKLKSPSPKEKGTNPPSLKKTSTSLKK